MKLAQHLQNFYLGFLSAPKSDRVIFRCMTKNKTCSMVEIGMGSVRRSKKLIEHAQRVTNSKKVMYTAIDLFDSRPPDLTPLKLIETHRTLCRTGAAVKLVPGEGNSVMAQIANSLTNSDLILISSCSDVQSQAQLWFYLPRMLHGNSAVFRQLTDSSGQRGWTRLKPAEISKLSKSAARRAA